MAKRVLMAGLSHETHTFIPKLTRLKDFNFMDEARDTRVCG